MGLVLAFLASEFDFGDYAFFAAFDLAFSFAFETLGAVFDFGDFGVHLIGIIDDVWVSVGEALIENRAVREEKIDLFFNFFGVVGFATLDADLDELEHEMHQNIVDDEEQN